MFGADAGLFPQHVHVRDGKVDAVVQVVGTRRNQLNGIGAKESQFPDVLVVLVYIPGAVAVGFVSVAQLMAYQRKIGGSVNIQIGGDLAAVSAHAHAAQQPTRSEQHSPRAVALNANSHALVALFADHPVGIPGISGRFKVTQPQHFPCISLSCNAQGDHVAGGRRIGSYVWPDQSAVLNLFLQNLGCFSHYGIRGGVNGDRGSRNGCQGIHGVTFLYRNWGITMSRIEPRPGRESFSL